MIKNQLLLLTLTSSIPLRTNYTITARVTSNFTCGHFTTLLQGSSSIDSYQEHLLKSEHVANFILNVYSRNSPSIKNDNVLKATLGELYPEEYSSRVRVPKIVEDIGENLTYQELTYELGVSENSKNYASISTKKMIYKNGCKEENLKVLQQRYMQKNFCTTKNYALFKFRL